MDKKKTAKKKTAKKKRQTAKKKRRGQKPMVATPDQRIAVTSLRRAGMGLAEICRVMKISKPVIKRLFVNELGPLVSGHRPFVPTARDRKNVEAMAGFGMSHKEIAKLVENPRTEKPICKQTLDDEFPRELSTGSVKANSKVAEALYNKAVGTGSQAVTACIWWTKCRMGWRGDSLELTGPEGGPLEVVSTEGPKDRIRDLISHQREAAIAAAAAQSGDGNGTGGNGTRVPDHG